MMVIFTASSDLGSARNTSRFIGPILRWLNPEITDQAIRQVQLFARKGAHIAEYAVLALLVWRGRRIQAGSAAGWSWPEFWGIVGFCALYAASDEFHQSLVASRYSSVFDVMLDTLGAALGLLALYSFRRWRESKRVANGFRK